VAVPTASPDEMYKSIKSRYKRIYHEVWYEGGVHRVRSIQM